MNIYLDIDGVLLNKEGEPANHLAEFLEKAIAKHDCYWLTTHCKGNDSNPLEHFREKVSKETFELMKKIKPTNWNLLKTEAIDFNSDFLWLDDNLFESEKKVLEENNALKNFIPIDLQSNPDQLLEII